MKFPLRTAFDVSHRLWKFMGVLGFCFVLSFCLFRAAPMAYGGSQATGQILAVAAGLHHSHSNSGSEARLRRTPQLTAMADPQPNEQGQGSNTYSHGC